MQNRTAWKDNTSVQLGSTYKQLLIYKKQAYITCYPCLLFMWLAVWFLWVHLQTMCLTRFYFGIQSTHKYDAIWSWSWNIHYESKKLNTKQEQYHTVQHLKHFIRIIHQSNQWKIYFGYNYSSRLNNHSSESSYVLSFKYVAREALPLSAEVYLFWVLDIRSSCKSQWQTQVTS